MKHRIYVSPCGCGLLDGSSAANAVCGIASAVDAARSVDGDCEIYLLPGEYVLQETLRLDERDSGTSFVGENAVVTSAVTLGKGQDAGGGIVRFDVPADAQFTRFFINGELRERTRYPENGHLTPLKAPLRLDGWANNMEGEDLEQLSKKLLYFTPGDIPAEIYREEDVEFVVLQFWMEARLYLDKLDREKGEALFKTGSWRSLSWSFGYYLENIREGLSSPGRWYHDRGENYVYYRLRDGECAECICASYPGLKTLVEVSPSEGCDDFVHDISFSGITFDCTNANTAGQGCYYAQAELHAPQSVIFANTVNGSFEHCTFRNLGGCALWLRKGSRDWNIERCEFSHCGAGAVRIGQEGRPAKLSEKAGRVRFVNNRIADCGEFYLGSAGIWIGQSGYNLIAHNDISGPLQWAISVGWNWCIFPLNESRGNRIEKNFVHELGTGELGTHGAIYVLGVSPETKLDGNYIRNVYSTPYWGGGEGIILDNGCSGVVIQNNVVVNASAGGWGCNFDSFGNVIRNNIFCFGEKFQLTRYGDPPSTPNPPPNGEVFSQNIVLWKNGPLFYEKEWYSYRTFWDYNLYWCTEGEVDFMGMTHDEWKERGLDVHSVIADPLLADPENEDFTFGDNSPAFDIGFEKIAIDDVGIIQEL